MLIAKTYKRGSDGLFVTVLTTDDGKRVPHYAKTKTESREKAEAAWLRMKHGGPLKDSTDTLAEWVDQWMELTLKANNQKRAIKPTTLAWYQRMIRDHIRAKDDETTPGKEPNPWAVRLGQTKLAKLNWKHVQVWVNEMENQDYDARTVHACYSLLKRILAAAVPDEIPHNPCNDRKVSLAPKVKVEKVPMSLEEQGDFFTASDQRPLAPLYRTMFMLGLRRGEVLGLKWDDIERKHKDGPVINIQRTLATWKLEGKERVTDFLTPKTEKSKRTLPLVPELLALLDRHHAAQERFRRRPLGHGKVVRVRHWEDNGLIFPSDRGTPMCERNLNRDMAKVIKLAGLKGNFHPHLMRHGTASEMLRRGASLKEVSEFLGHSQISITADLYGHVIAEQKRTAAETMAYLAKLGGKAA